MSRVSLADFKAYVRVQNTASDAELQAVLDAASAWIDDHCGAPERQFTADVTATARTFPTFGRIIVRGSRVLLLVPDIANDTGLSPYAAIAAMPGQPITQLYPGTSYVDEWVTITARWGWPSVPDPVLRAELILATRLWKRRDSPEGIVGNDQWGVIRVGRVDPDVLAMLDPYVLPGLA